MGTDRSLLSGDMALLVLELMREGDLYGYEMTEALEKRSENAFHLKAGTLYPLLHAMERAGWVESYEGESAAGKPRRYYRLTEAGRAALEEKKRAWTTYAAAMRRVLGGEEHVPEP